MPCWERSGYIGVRQWKSTGCLGVPNSRESVISVIEDSQDQHILMELASRI